jgi:hypothetical protein
MPSNRVVLISALLILPALFLCVCGVLESAFGLTAVNNLVGSILATPAGSVLLSGATVMGGVFISLALNLWMLCRIRVGLDTGTVYVTFYVARALRHLIFAAVATSLAGLLLFYVFVENFRIVAR